MEYEDRKILRVIAYFLFAVCVILFLISIWGSASYSDKMAGTAAISGLVGAGVLCKATF